MSSPQAPVQEFTHKRAIRAGFASFVGTSIEFYDFYVFATAAALVFGPIFFPEADPVTGILASFATYAIGFLFRPLGGIIFGHIGDRIGRQRSLVLTLLLMGVATTLVGVLPVYENVGIWAPIMLLILRAMQGLAVGGEWGGAVLMSVENAPERYKGLYGAFPQLGNPMGALLASGIFALLTINGDQFLLDGGWRIPFLLSAVLIAVGFWVRYRVEETPVFEQQQAEGGVQKNPLNDAVKRNWKAILIGMGLIPISTGGYYIVTTFATSYGTEPSFGIGIDANDMLTVLSVAALCELISTLFIGALADKVGRKQTFFWSLVITSVLVIPMFLTMSPENLGIMFVLFALTRVAMNGTWAPLSSIMAQMFDAKSRQTSLSVSYSFGNAIWAGFSPLVATWLFQQTGSIWSVITMFLIMAAISIVCLFLAPQKKDYVFDPRTAAVTTDGAVDLNTNGATK
ncbi:MFS transporter [Gulosibacter molinativorax]|uniref:MFS transporter n=1 Tax=Gulosibacter molinativorax TaxID=256821 RepID=A0ABT7C8C4_9MICO|nr:MFS transporter [Gulosibacter molinativorax]MDJ1371402.1 MFS transporter [Gulosibacter molinativorax]QUY62900.1 Shikimate transporter [Gulosibacter molinativorax]